MKINSLIKLTSLYDAIFHLYIDTGIGETEYGQHPALTHFIDSYNELRLLISYWEQEDVPMTFTVRTIRP